MRPATAAILTLLGPSPALACSCVSSSMDAMRPEMRAVYEARLRESAGRIQYVVEAEVVADTRASVCSQGQRDVLQATHQTLRIDRVLRGEVPATLQLRTQDVLPTAQGCGVSTNSCEVTVAVGSRGIWPLEKRDGEWRLADVCQFDAFRRRFSEAREGAAAR